MRAIGLLVLLLALVVATLAALVVAGHPKLPQPFGPARNGLVAYADGGDIYTVDPVTGRSTPIVTGADTDIDPRWSRDGTLLAFQRQDSGDSRLGLMFVTRADGSGLVRLTPQPLAMISSTRSRPTAGRS